MQKLIKGDKVKILLGKDRGKEGTIEKLLINKGKLFIGGVNVVKRHVKGREGVEGGIIDIIKPINISNAALICPNCKKQTRVGFEIMKDGKKVRVCRKCKKQI